MLENTVEKLTELRHIKRTAPQLQVTTGAVISYNGYISLIYSAAQSYDTQFSTRIHSKGQNCTVYQHEIDPDENNEEYDYHVDTNIGYLIIKFTNLNIKNKHKDTHTLPQPNGMNYHLDPNRYGIN